MSEKSSNSKNIRFCIVKGEIAAYIFTFAVIITCAAVLTYTNAEESLIGIVSAVCTFLSTFLSGFIISSGAEKRGILWGMLGGIFYVILLMTMLFLTGRNVDFTTGKLICIAISLLGGAIGGIFGINHKK